MEYRIKPQRGITLNINELWEYRELFYFFTWRDIKVKYKQTALGFLWAILQPLLMMLIFSFFFGRVIKIPSESTPYPIFVFTGLILWNVFSTGLTNAGNSMITNSNIIKKIYFPRLIIPISAILGSLFDFLMALIVYVGLLLYYHFEPNIWKVLLYFPISIIIASTGTFGLGSLLAALNVKYRDFRYILPFLVQILLFLTPVIYPVSIVSEPWQQVVLSLNPMTGSINLLRYAILDIPLNVTHLIISIASSMFLFIIGLIYFRKTEAYFADLA